RSRAAAASTIVTSLIDDGCSATPGKSGHFTCSRERTDHVLPTRRRRRVAGRACLDYAVATLLRRSGRRFPVAGDHGKPKRSAGGRHDRPSDHDASLVPYYGKGNPYAEPHPVTALAHAGHGPGGPGD